MAGQLFAVNSLGGFYYSLNLSKELRYGVQAKAKFRQFADIRDAFGKVQRSGQTFTWDTVPMMARANRALTETNTIPQGNHTVYQGTLTMSERGFSVPYSEFLESLSQFAVKQPIMKVLKYDALCDIEATVYTEFNKTPMRFAADSSAASPSLTTNSSATVTNSVPLSKVNVRSIVDQMKDRDVPFYDGASYMAIARHGGLRGLKNDMESIHQYTESGLEMIHNGEIGRYEDTRFVEQTVIPKGGATDSATFNAFTNTADAWNVSGAGDWVFFFGEDTVCEAVHTPEEIRGKAPDDYGRSKGVVRAAGVWHRAQRLEQPGPSPNLQVRFGGLSGAAPLKKSRPQEPDGR
jgi:N4-gp56 family major capsid protein